MNKEQLILKLYELGVLQFGQFTLKSGLSSPFYLDFRRIIAYPETLKDISEQLWKLIEDLEFDHLCGVPYAALSLSSAMSMMHGKPMVVKRKEAKEHGTKKLVEGIFHEGQKCVVIDDVISSGISMIETLEAIEVLPLWRERDIRQEVFIPFRKYWKSYTSITRLTKKSTIEHWNLYNTIKSVMISCVFKNRPFPN